MVAQQSHIFEILTAFARALSHQIRTPLGTINNEIFSAQGQAGRQDLSLASDQLLRVVQILSSTTILGDTALRSDKIDLGKAISECYPQASLPGEVMIVGDEGRLKTAVRLLQELPNLDSNDSPQLKLCVEQNQAVFAYSQNFASAYDQKTFSSLTGLFHGGYQIDAVLPMLIDAVMLAHAVGYEVCSGAQLRVLARFELK